MLIKIIENFNLKFSFRFAHVTQDNISIVLFDAHGSTGQDESYLKNNQPDWLERQYDDYIKVAK
jgi:dipeptidyl aminopeptidase/acylaminoacyl peptidase